MMQKNYLPGMLLVLAITLELYVIVDYFMMDATFNYWLFILAIIVFFLGIAARSKSKNNNKK